MTLKNKCFISLLVWFAAATTQLFGQDMDTSKLRMYGSVAARAFSSGLDSGKAYEALKELSNTVGARLSGSPQAAQAVEWGKKTMERFGLDKVHLEPVKVPHWVRGASESGRIVKMSTPDPEIALPARLNICALGGSIATPGEGVTGELLEVLSFEDLHKRKDEGKGKIIFFDRPFDRSKLNSFEMYGGAVNQRSQGAIEASKVGGIAALVRSMTSRIDDVPHTGAMSYNDSVTKVPSAAVSTRDADMLADMIRKGGRVWVNLKLSCETLPDTESSNVVGELTGSEKPEEVIVIGGHLDSWDKGQGAHDDGAGVCQSLEALRLLREMGLRPKRTIRAVLFMNEENGLRGGIAYAAKERLAEKHIVAIESDAGGFTPRGFGVSGDTATFKKVLKWAPLFAPIDADRITRGGGGADISELGKKGTLQIGLRVDGHRYFDYHHSDNDTFDKVNERELELGAASMAVLAYVLSQEGL